MLMTPVAIALLGFIGAIVALAAIYSLQCGFKRFAAQPDRPQAR